MKILLIFGGDSAESEISILTAKQIFEMGKGKWDIVPILIKKGRMFWCRSFRIVECAKDELDPKLFCEIVIAGKTVFLKRKKLKRLFEVDAAVVAAHGGSGENGELCAFLKMNQIPCSVGDPTALAIAMDKVFAKAVFRDFDVPVVDGFWFLKSEWRKDRKNILAKVKQLGYPLCVKPARQGSSVGISFAKNKTEFEKALSLAFEFDDKVLIERGLVGFRELNVSVMSVDGQIEVSEIEEPVRASDILSFADKYLGGQKCTKTSVENAKIGDISQKIGCKNGNVENGMAGSKRKFPAEIEPNVRDEIRAIAKDVARKLGFFGVARFDFLLLDGKVFLNEINSVPGSLAFYFWAKNGALEGYFDRLVDLCLKQKNDQKSCVVKILK